MDYFFVYICDRSSTWMQSHVSVLYGHRTLTHVRQRTYFWSKVLVLHDICSFEKLSRKTINAGLNHSEFDVITGATWFRWSSKVYSMPELRRFTVIQPNSMWIQTCIKKKLVFPFILMSMVFFFFQIFMSEQAIWFVEKRDFLGITFSF